MAILPRAELATRLAQARALPDEARGAGELRSVVRLQNELDATMQRSLDDMVASIDRDTFEPGSLDNLRRVAVPLPPEGDNQRAIFLAIREAEARLKNAIGITNVQVFRSEDAKQLHAIFRVAPEHPTRQRIAELLAARRPPPQTAARRAEFLAELVDRWEPTSPEVMRRKQAWYAQGVIEHQPWQDGASVLGDSWNLPMPAAHYFPIEPSPNSPPFDLVVAESALGEARERLKARGAHDVKMKIGRDGSVKVAVVELVQGQAEIARGEPPPGYVPQDPGAIDAHVTALEDAFAGAAARLVAATETDACGGKPLSAEQAGLVRASVRFNRLCALDMMAALTRVRAALATAGYANSRIETRGEGSTLLVTIYAEATALSPKA